ncbi:BPI fold-containing family B member 6 [Ochotona curzoniae]|uniref:BPI fold-containing family B member 6 n=1 Tax=Ochotona curzoniae TaxID=130825 RepID=UPI001B34ECF0|nr:BPI fold-containing family B member 6 [Ochotona curzoniae]
MRQVLWVALCSLLAGVQAEPGVLLRLGMDVMNHEVQSAMDESHILEQLAAEAGKPQPGMKPIKGISNMKVKDVQLPVITLKFVPGVGISQCVSTGMTITGKSFMGGNMEIIIVLNITATNRLAWGEETGLPVFSSEGCEITLVSVKTNLPSNMLPKMVKKFLDSTLHKVLPNLLCPAIDAVLVYVNRNWEHLNDPMPVGQLGTIRYALAAPPTTTVSFIQVDFSPVVQQPAGKTIKVTAVDGEALEFPEGYAEGSSQLLLSAAFLTAELALLQESLAMNIREPMVGELLLQTTEILASFIPKVAEAYPKPRPIVAQVKINKPPKVTIKAGSSLLHLHGTLELFAAQRPRGQPPTFLFLLEIHFNLRIQYSVHENQLQMATSLNRVLSLTGGASSVGNFNEEELTGFVADYLQAAYVPVVNDVLLVGFPLPDVPAVNYDLAELDIVENALVLDLKLD